jgi:hypothetical protein
MRASDDHKDGVVEVLTHRHPLFARTTIERWVGQAFDSYRSAPVQTYVPILAQREVDARLSDLEADGTRPAGAGGTASGRVAPGLDVVDVG